MAEIGKDDTIIELTFGLDEPDAEDEEKNKFAQNLLKELKQLDEVEKAYQAEDPNPEAGAKVGLAKLVGILTTEVKFKHLTAFLGWLGNRFQDKPIRGSIKVGDKEVKFAVKSHKELEKFEQTALKLIEAMSEEKDE